MKNRTGIGLLILCPIILIGCSSGSQNIKEETMTENTVIQSDAVGSYSSDCQETAEQSDTAPISEKGTQEKTNHKERRLTVEEAKTLSFGVNLSGTLNTWEFEEEVAKLFDAICGGPDKEEDDEEGNHFRYYYLFDDDESEYISLGSGGVSYQNDSEGLMMGIFFPFRDSDLEGWIYDLTETYPYDTDMTGIHGGYIFALINGKIYRYSFEKTWDGKNEWGSKADVGEKLFECKEDNGDEIYEYTVCNIGPWTNLRYLYCKCENMKTGDVNESVIRLRPPAKTSEKELNKAIEAGFVIMENGNVTKGKEAWEDFYANVLKGNEASVTVGYYYTSIGENVDADLLAATNEDYPVLYLRKIEFDGEKFKTSPLHRIGNEYVVYEKTGIDSPERTWNYLLDLSDEGEIGETEEKKDKRYVLCNNKDVTWGDLWKGMVSSRLGDYIAFEMVYSEDGK